MWKGISSTARLGYVINMMESKERACRLTGWIVALLPLSLIGLALRLGSDDDAWAWAPSHTWFGSSFNVSRFLSLVAASLLLYVLFWVIERVLTTEKALWVICLIATVPAFWIQSTRISGHALAWLAQSVLFAAALLIHEPRAHHVPIRLSWALAACAALGCVVARGVLLGLLPPLTGFVFSQLQTKKEATGISPGLVVSTGLWVIVVVGLLVGIYLDLPPHMATGWSQLFVMGETLRATSVPTFDVILETWLHNMAPWSAFLPWLALLAVTQQNKFVLCFGWIWLCTDFAAAALWGSGFGSVPSWGVVPGALLLALALGERRTISDADHQDGLRLMTITSCLLIAILIRDQRLYPHSFMDGSSDPLHPINIPIDQASIIKALWSVGLLIVMLGLIGWGWPHASVHKARPDSLWQYIRGNWRIDLGHRFGWIIYFALALALGALSLFSFFKPLLGLNSLGVRWLRRLSALYVLGPGLVFYLPWVSAWVHRKLTKLQRLPISPLMATGLLAFILVSQGAWVALALHLSHDSPIAFFKKHASSTAKLFELKDPAMQSVEVEAKKHSLHVQALGSVSDAVNHLTAEPRDWVLTPKSRFIDIYQTYQQRNPSHTLWVPNDTGANIWAVTARAVENTKNNNPLLGVVSHTPWSVQIKQPVVWENGVELIGYTIEYPNGQYAAVGDTCSIKWVYRSTRAYPGTWQVFLHIDRRATRVHGDHEPVHNFYPVERWRQDEYILDEHTIDIPGTVRGGDYTMYLGFYRNETRAKVTQGAQDGENRAVVGVLKIR